LSFVVVVGIGIDTTNVLFCGDFLSHPDVYLGEVGINSTVLSVLNNNPIVTSGYRESLCHHTLKYCTCIAARRSLNVDAFIVGGHVFQYRVLLYSEAPADKALLYRPGESAHIGCKVARY